MQEANGRIKPNGFRGAPAIMREQRIQKRKQGIHWVKRGAAGAAAKTQFDVG